MYYLAKIYSLLVVENAIEFAPEIPERVRVAARSPPTKDFFRSRASTAVAPDNNEIDGADTKRIQRLLVTSTVKAIHQVNHILKTVKNRRAFGAKVSFAVMLGYKEKCDLLLKELAIHCPKVRRHEPAFFPGVQVVGAMPTHEITKMIGEMQAAGWKADLLGLLEDACPDVAVRTQIR